MYTYTYTYTYMQVTIFIRKENEDQWKQIGNKSQWVNERLKNIKVNDDGTLSPRDPKKKSAIYTAPAHDKTPDIGNEFDEAIKARENSCCKRAVPCKHWEWSVESEQWINQLTGEVKGAENEV